MNSGYIMIDDKVITGKSNRTKALQGLLPPPVVASLFLVGLIFILRSYYERISQPESRMDKSA